jgi:hypothetical protein
MNWADSIPVVTALGAMFVAGGAWMQLRTLKENLKSLDDRFAGSAKDQGTRIGNLESWQYAVERENKAVRRVRREVAAEQSRGIPHPVGDDEDSEP